MSEQWLNKLRKKMADYEEPSPEGLWNDIENIMSEQKPKAKRTRVAPIKWRAALLAAAALALAVWLGYDALYTHNSDNKGIVPAISLSTTETLREEKNTINQNTDLPKQYAYNAPHILKKYAPETGTTATETTISVAHTESESDSKPSTNTQATINKDNNKQHTDAITTTRTEGNEKRVANIDFNKAKRESGNWTVNVYESNVTAANNKVGGYSLMQLNKESQVSDNGALNDNGLMDAILFNQNKDASTEVHHRLPIKVGVTVNIPLSQRWSIETGLTYTYLSSQITSGSDSYGYTSEQKLHYIGIPINANYKIWTYKKFDLYATAGGAVEKCFSGNLTTDYVIRGNKENGKSESVMVKQLQCSMNASVGFQLNLTPNIGIYAEPGAGYYFDNGSEIPTVYSEKPLNFNLRMGLRVTL